MVLTVFSCTKQNADSLNNEVKGTRITLSVEAPEVTEETKVTYGGTTTYNNSIRHMYRWEAGDKMGVYSLEQTKGDITNWGEFATDEGADKNGKATFTGFVPATYVGSNFFALHTYSTVDYKLFWNSTRYDFGFNIPAEQDGTGVKYSLFAAKPDYDPSTQTLSVPSSGSNQFFLRSALTVFEVPADADVREIKVTATGAKTGAAQNLVSNGEALDVYMNSSSFALWGAGYPTVTINNGGVLSGKVWFASRQANGSASIGYIKLSFEFTNGAGKVAKKVVKLGLNLNADGTAGTYKNISNSVVNNLGAVSFAEGDFK